MHMELEYRNLEINRGSLENHLPIWIWFCFPWWEDLFLLTLSSLKFMTTFKQ